jgi:heme-degrading monooxygenase HmoA
MYARTLKIQLSHDRINEASKLFAEQVLPLCENKKGYKGGQFFADRKTGNCLMMTLWETEEDLLETEHSRFFQEQIVKFMNFFITPPIREIYEVLYLE